MRRILTLMMLAVAVVASAWQPDSVCPGFEMRYVDMGRDYSGTDVRTAIVRLQTPKPTGRGLLYVHGYTDWFHGSDTVMARAFVDHGYEFYAVDLRKNGRSLMPGQTKYQLRNIKEYFTDIDSALTQMRADGVREIAMMGFSMGGLTTAAYMAKHPDCGVRALILNSPFLDWNQSKFQEKILLPIVDTLAPLMKNLWIPRGAGYEPVQASWLKAIDDAHAIVQKTPRITVPILLLRSDKSVKKGDPAGTDAHADGTLDVEDIEYYGLRLGPNVTEIVVPGAPHNAVRPDMFADMFAWLQAAMP